MAGRPKPPMAAWIARERKRRSWKPRDVVAALAAQGIDVQEQTIRVWEGYSDRKPAPFTIEALERAFGTSAPAEAAISDQAAIVAAIDRLTAAVERSTADRVGWERELVRDLGAMLRGERPGAEPEPELPAPTPQGPPGH